MNNKVLCVDDEPNVLDGIKRGLRGKFEIQTALGGNLGIQAIMEDGPFAVIVSDMRMPEMDGVEFLSRAKELAPDSVRIMLTGNSDQQTATEAVNKGSIFRFMTKPCTSDVLGQTIEAALKQYGLVTAEKELLEVTLNKSLQVLVDVVALVNSTAFSRSARVKKMSRDIAERLGAQNLWEIEIAAMLSQIGCITVPEVILEKVAKGATLNDEELGLYQRHPQVAFQLISQIPRMESVAEIITNQNRRSQNNAETQIGLADMSTEVLGARILKVVLDYDKLIQNNSNSDVALSEMCSREGWYDRRVIDVLREVVTEDVGFYTNTEMKVAELKPGMILEKPLYAVNGSFLLSTGHEITLSLILRLENFLRGRLIEDRVSVRVPEAEFAEALV